MAVQRNYSIPPGAPGCEHCGGPLGIPSFAAARKGRVLLQCVVCHEVATAEASAPEPPTVSRVPQQMKLF